MSSPEFNRPFLRNRALARTLHARLWVSPVGRIFVVRGNPEFHRLRHCLVRRCAPPTAVEAPTPVDLSLLGCDGELTEAMLHEMARAQAAWSRALDEETARKPSRRRSRPAIDAERQELTRLRRRLAACRRWQEELLFGSEPAGAPLLLDECEEAALNQLLGTGARGRSFPPLVAWLARVVFWLSGGRATCRFLQAVAQHADGWEQFAPAEQLLKLERRLHSLRKRSLTERPYAITAELRHALAALPPQLVSGASLTARPRSLSLARHCDLLIANCRRMRAKSNVGWHQLPATLAAWAAADGGAAPLPPRLVRLGLEAKQSALFERLLERLASQFGERAYDRLLLAIEQLPHLVCWVEVGPLRQLLAQGANLDDLCWAAEHGQVWNLARSGIAPGVARRIASRLSHAGIALADNDLSQLLPALKTSRETALADRWLGWLGQFSGRWLTPRLKSVLASAMTELVAPALSQEGLRDCLRQWLKPPGVRPIRALEQSTLADWLARIAAYQSLAGGTPAVPKSLRKWQPHPTATANANTNSPQAIRSAQEALLLIAVNSLRQLLARRIEAWWQQQAACPLPNVPLGRAIRLIRWLDALDADQREMLRQVGAGWTLYGGQYRCHLPQNRQWLAGLSSSGKNLSPWFQASDETATLSGQQVRVALARDPREILLMGDYFGTCLSLGDCNELSLLANAHDANKQVVYVEGTSSAGRRQVLARQLITISDDYRLLGYRCYVGLDKRQQAERESCIQIVAAFCGRLARRCCMTLADEGKPEPIGGHFWYDDGTHAWHPTAQAAWNVEDRRQQCDDPTFAVDAARDAPEEIALVIAS